MPTRAFAPWFDAHLDLAYLAECGRDMDAPLDGAGGPHPPAAVTWPALREGGVRFCLGTIFTEADGTDAVGYPSGDAKSAADRGRAQLAQYQRAAATGRISLMPRRGVACVGACDTDAPISLGILMENADPIASPGELEWWVSQGLVAIGLSWAKASRYAGGNSVTTGLTDLGRVLVGEMDRVGVVIDVSHLSDASLAQVLELTDSPIIASHSNCRMLLEKANQRHLTDDAIIEIARRGGVIGLNLYGKFLTPPGAERTPTIDDAIRHLERVCELVGHRRAVGLGSDMDGGFSAEGLPDAIRSPRDLSKLLDALHSRGWSDDDLRGFGCDNWLRFWGW